MNSSPVARHISSASMAQSPHSALLSAGLVGTPNPYLARYRAGARAQDGVAEDAPMPSSARSDATMRSGQSPSPSLDASVRLCDALLSELKPDSLLSVPTATFSSKFSTRATVNCCPFSVPRNRAAIFDLLHLTAPRARHAFVQFTQLTVWNAGGCDVQG